MEKTLMDVLASCAPAAPAGFGGPTFRVARHPNSWTPTFYADYVGRPADGESGHVFSRNSRGAFGEAWAILGGSDGYRAEVWAEIRPDGTFVLSWAVSLFTAEAYRAYLRRRDEAGGSGL